MIGHTGCDAFVGSYTCSLQAFANAGSDVSAIVVRIGSIPLGAFQELLPISQQLSQCFANLKTLDISVPYARQGFVAFVNFLALVPAVTKLALRFAVRTVRAT
jgi:hypothetical protein